MALSTVENSGYESTDDFATFGGVPVEVVTVGCDGQFCPDSTCAECRNAGTVTVTAYVPPF